MSEEIPFERLGIPAALAPRVAPGAPSGPKSAIARGLLPVPPDVLLAVCYLLTMDADPAVAEAAASTLRNQPLKQIQIALSEKTHPKVLEYLAEFRVSEPELDIRLLRLRATNARAARLIGRRAAADLCDEITRNHERLLLTPEIVIELHANPACSDALLERATSFLDLEGCGVRLPRRRPFQDGETEPAAPAQNKLPLDPEEEIEAALRGELSPALQRRVGSTGSIGAFADASSGNVGQFRYDFADEDDFDSLLTFEEDGKTASVEEKKTMIQVIAGMTVAQKLKLAYLGNKESRAILIRDRVKSVPVAVVRSGRLSDGEVITYAADRNLPRDVIREISMTKEFVRKYNVKVALANNPKTPLQSAIGFLKDFYKKDLQNLGRNKNVPSVLSGAAFNMARAKN